MKRVDLITKIRSVIFDNLSHKISAIKHQQLEIDIINSIVTKEDDIVNDLNSTATDKVASANTVKQLNDKFNLLDGGSVEAAQEATEIALAAAENSPKTITLLSVSTEPTGTIHVGDKYYNSTDKLIRTVYDSGEGDLQWDNGVSPRVQDVHLFGTGRYEWISNDLILTNKSITGNSSGAVAFTIENGDLIANVQDNSSSFDIENGDLILNI